MPEVLTPLVSTACADFRDSGVPPDDLTQQAWVYALEARAAYDPARHSCTLAAYVVTVVKRRLARFCQRERRHAARPLPASAESREASPELSAIINERVRAERKKLDGGPK